MAKINQIRVPLTEAADQRLRRYLRDKVVSIRSGLKELHETKLEIWRKAYEAIPAQTVREFPFHGASNLIVPVIAIHSDTLLARVMAAVYKTTPLWTTRLIGSFPKEMRGDELRGALEQHLGYIGVEPSELDLYRVYHEWFGETIKYGTSTVKSPWEQRIEDIAMPSGDDGANKYYSEIKYEGCRPEKIPFRDFGITPTARTVETAPFKYHRLRYQRDELEERAYRGIYDKEAVKKILGKPDRTSPDYIQQSTEADTGAHTVSGYGWAEYDVYECHFKYKIGRHYTRLIVWYNEQNDVILRAFHNYYPDDIFTTARLFYRDDFFFGYGFAETLAMLQEEVSQIHNNRRDNSTVANTMVWRVDPDSELHKGYRIFPGATVPAKKDEAEGMSPGQVSSMTIDEERLTLELAEKRSGVSGPIQGMGSGTMSKRGVYSSMGTLSLLQEGNTRTDLNITDIRYAHTKLGRIIARQEAEFGADSSKRFERYGDMAQRVQQALQLIKQGRITLPVYASTASVNREVEKQNDMMLTGLAQRHYQTIAQMLQMTNSPVMDPTQKQYLLDAIDAGNYLMKSVFRHFGHDEPEKFVPEPVKAGPGAPPPNGMPAPQPGATPPNAVAAGGAADPSMVALMTAGGQGR
jgi:hypothetical protein